jgi:hypothetical protein
VITILQLTSYLIVQHLASIDPCLDVISLEKHRRARTLAEVNISQKRKQRGNLLISYHRLSVISG